MGTSPLSTPSIKKKLRKRSVSPPQTRALATPAKKPPKTRSERAGQDTQAAQCKPLT